MSFSKVLKEIVTGDLGEPGSTFIVFPEDIVDILNELGYSLADIPDIFLATLNNDKSYYFAPYDPDNSFFRSAAYNSLLATHNIGVFDYIDSRSEFKGFDN